MKWVLVLMRYMKRSQSNMTNIKQSIISIMDEVGYCPSLRTMAKFLKEKGITISAQGLHYRYLQLVEDGVLIDTNESPRWVLAKR